MKDHEQMIRSVLEKSSVIIEKRKRRGIIIRRTALSVSGVCAAAVLGFGIWNIPELRGGLSPDPDDGYIQTTDSPETAVPSATTTVHTTAKSAETTAAKTSAKTTSKTVQTTAVTAAQSTGAGYTAAYVQTSQTAQASAGTTVTATATAVRTTSRMQTSPTTQTVQTITETAKVHTTAVTTALTEHRETTSTTKPYNSGNVDPEDQPYCSCSSERFNGIVYKSNSEYKLSEELIGEKLGDTIASLGYYKGYKGRDELFSVSAEVFTIKDISPKFGAAFRYENSDEYYFYAPLVYAPETVGELLDGSGLIRNTEVRFANYFPTPTSKAEKYDVTDLDFLWDSVFTDRSVKVYQKGMIPVSITAMKIVISMPDLGLNGSIGISLNGWLSVEPSRVQSVNAFFIGEEKAEELIEYITQNYEMITD